VQDAIDRADGDVLVVADADVWSDYTADLIGCEWGSPHRMVRRLTPEATLDVLNGQPPAGPLEQHHKATLGGGIVVLTRDAWNEAP
jgi:hypothetical protein